MSHLLVATKFVAKISVGLFAGNCSYCTLIEQPARMKSPTNVGIIHWRNGFKKAAGMQSVLSIVASTSVLITNYYEPNKKWLYSGLLLLTILPYTALSMMSTNFALLDKKLEENSEKAKVLLGKWGNLHAVRSVIALIAFALISYP